MKAVRITDRRQELRHLSRAHHARTERGPAGMPLVEWIGAWPGAVFLHDSGTAYLLVNAAHIRERRFAGRRPSSRSTCDCSACFRHAPLGSARVRSCRAPPPHGAVLAILTGLWLFSVKPRRVPRQCRVSVEGGTVDRGARQRWRSSTAITALRPPSLAASCGRRCAWSLGARSCCRVSVLVAGRWIGFL